MIIINCYENKSETISLVSECHIKPSNSHRNIVAEFLFPFRVTNCVQVFDYLQIYNYIFQLEFANKLSLKYSINWFDLLYFLGFTRSGSNLKH